MCPDSIAHQSVCRIKRKEAKWSLPKHTPLSQRPNLPLATCDKKEEENTAEALTAQWKRNIINHSVMGKRMDKKLEAAPASFDLLFKGIYKLLFHD
ncbi:hypothetical protein Tco_0067602 [Tanacetum coccineum]